jgi:hypothetical protein
MEKLPNYAHSRHSEIIQTTTRLSRRNVTGKIEIRRVNTSHKHQILPTTKKETEIF